ncbi:MAG: hypothetical protein H7099_13790 [Gemmatimonadaceae bacterium]|nr:hypothetical protein [Gemmatimonadaceae bacterium]
MLTTLAHANFGPFVALLLAAGVMAAISAGIEDDRSLSGWCDQVRATRRFFVIAGLLGIASLTQGVDASVAWTLGVGVAFGVDVWGEVRQLATKGR